ncbi:hypothetical protein DERF_010622 [Dermatophagoides farinae]|uniref:Uncharacterized protein n=1 Tax=Dermatophagoides farinae TaxID=6954 RepID=A0A922HQM7_DERFA|nr:hypothetical protein DERF_010622 [Dermatophagoides farinae]
MKKGDIPYMEPSSSYNHLHHHNNKCVSSSSSSPTFTNIIQFRILNKKKKKWAVISKTLETSENTLTRIPIDDVIDELKMEIERNFCD